MKTNITDLHCDLLLYLAKAPGASILATEDIGVTLPYLLKGNVKHQVLAIFATTGAESVHWGELQLQAYQDLLQQSPFFALTDSKQLDQPVKDQIGVTLAIENASILATEEESLETAFARLDNILNIGKRLFYITITHHTENRFGGGNYSTVGLKPDGEALLDYMAEKDIPVDLSHTSDAMAYDIINYIDKKRYDLAVIASHSNFRILRNHSRNLPSELVVEIVNRNGLIGANFLRLFLDGDQPSSLLEHIRYGLANAPKCMAFGADFFYRLGIPAPERQPLFFPEYEDAGQYPKILQQLNELGVTEQELKALAHGNAERFIRTFWG
jgi:microsomal dipeptidase-like Zn-dependent dipeptidase